MATYVFSDVHGHAAPLRRLIERIAPADDDRFFCLGDMVDRGPDPMDVIAAVRALPHVCVLSGNHEDLMLSWLGDPGDGGLLADWTINGGGTTLAGFSDLDPEARDELVAWLESLPVYAVCTVGERIYVLVHAGILPYTGPARTWDEAALEELLAAANPQDLMWVRHAFWEHPTGLIDASGTGPVVIAGHTPTVYLGHMRASIDRPPLDDDGICQIVRVGNPDACGGVYDKWNIDSGAAGGAGFGCITIVRLDDEAAFSEPIRPGE